MRDLDGLKMLIIGAGSGIGAAFAQMAHAEGARTYTADLVAGDDIDRAVDVADDRQRRELVDSAVDSLKGLDVLVSTAGIARFGPIAQLEPATYAETFAVNVIGIAAIAGYARPALAQSDNASIITVASAIGALPYAGSAAYGTSKAALIQVQGRRPRIRSRRNPGELRMPRTHRHSYAPRGCAGRHGSGPMAGDDRRHDQSRPGRRTCRSSRSDRVPRLAACSIRHRSGCHRRRRRVRQRGTIGQFENAIPQYGIAQNEQLGEEVPLKQALNDPPNRIAEAEREIRHSMFRLTEWKLTSHPASQIVIMNDRQLPQRSEGSPE